ncbi:hypothetical protein [Pseudomonas sp. NFACC39-1]|uniref:hypothetical protein n=1 Tax=Pseudomonas sp. NFACC39-1 TaxID=1566195 RepID=UPI0008CFCEDE|nr:hypothetical protein [Pseudomonas sp. NFACC39-1]SEO65584.1 hypothetical protein SAMN03159293_03481 [Pseudomonas sp. NFACC39-1]
MLIHAFDPVDFMTCNNLALKPLIMSPSCIALVDEGVGVSHVRVEDLNFASIQEAEFRSAVTPRTATFMKGFMLSREMTITDGYGSRRGWLGEEKDRLIKIYETELLMEEVRRRVAPEAPSRLGCIWVAEDGPHGRALLQEMFSGSRHIVSVAIEQKINLFKADASFYDQLFETGDPTAAERYWRGEALSSKWELLLDGAIRVTKDDELQVLLQDCRDAGHCLPMKK